MTAGVVDTKLLRHIDTGGWVVDRGTRISWSGARLIGTINIGLADSSST